MTRLEDLQQQLDDILLSKPETGEQWAEICALEAEIAKEHEAEAYDNGQFGVGA
jgi:RecA/RadA recombinase